MLTIARQLTMFLAAGLVVASAAVMADKVEKNEESLTIFEVLVDYDTSAILIIGAGLDAGPESLHVMLGDSDISDHCALDEAMVSLQSVLCDHLALPVEVDLLLTVSSADDVARTDEYDLTFGAVGPMGMKGERGEEGDMGDPGPRGIPGQAGPQGATAYSAFFDAAGCTSGGVLRFTDDGLKCLPRRPGFSTTPSVVRKVEPIERVTRGLSAADKLCQEASGPGGSITLVGKYMNWSKGSERSAQVQSQAVAHNGLTNPGHMLSVATTSIDLGTGEVVQSVSDNGGEIPHARAFGNSADNAMGSTEQWTEIYFKNYPNKCTAVLYRTVTRG